MSANETNDCGLPPVPPAVPAEARDPLTAADWPNYREFGELIFRLHKPSSDYFERTITLDEAIGIVTMYALNDVPAGEAKLPKIEAFLSGKSYGQVADHLNEQNRGMTGPREAYKGVKAYFEKTMPSEIFGAMRRVRTRERLKASDPANRVTPKTREKPKELTEVERTEEIDKILAATEGRNRGGAFSAGDFARLFNMTQKDVWEVIQAEIRAGNLRNTEAPFMRTDGANKTGHYYGKAAEVILDALHGRMSGRRSGSRGLYRPHYFQ